jgi:hypothetical protein
MHGKRLLRERNKDARKEIAARTPQECTDNDVFFVEIFGGLSKND